MSRPTRDPSEARSDFAYGTVTLYGGPFQILPLSSRVPTWRSRNPPTSARKHPPGFGLFPFRSPLLRESRLLSFPPGTEMFHFPGCRLTTLWIQAVMSRHYSGRVAPFGDPRIKACLPLPEAYRSLPRPSSPAGAKASTVCPPQLDQSSRRKPGPFHYAIVKEPTAVPGGNPSAAVPPHQAPAWWACLGSNQGPHPYQGCALTT